MSKSIVDFTNALVGAFPKKKIVAPVEASSTASKAYSAGNYLMLNETLYKVTADISKDGTIAEGTNVTATKITDELGGTGVPSGGTTGQMLIKNSSTDGDASWQSLDSAPTQSSTKPVTSGGIYTALQGKQSTLTFDDSPTSASNNPVKSGGVYAALSGKQGTITGAATSIASSDLTASRALVSDSSGKVAVSDVTSTELGYLDGVTSNVQTQLNGKQGTLTFDSSPTSGSSNPVTSGGVYTALSGKQATLTFDSAPTASSSNPVTSGGIKTALDAKITTTTTDPGEGSALANGNLLIVVEA